MHPCTALTPTQQRLLAVLLTASVTVCYGFGLYLFPLLLSDMRLSLGFDYAAVGWITALSQGGYMLGALLGAWLGQRLGELRLVWWSLSVTCLSLIVLSQGHSLYSIAPTLVLCGVWASLVWVPMVTVVARYFPPQHSGRLMGLLASGTHYGVFIDGLLVPWLLVRTEWPQVWLSFAVLSSVPMLLLAGFLYWQRQPLNAHHTSPHTHTSASTSSVLAGRKRILAILFLTGFSCMPFDILPSLKEGDSYGAHPGIESE